jgi:mannose-1-phosphate guanylyltransferase/phosphomannomutase
MATSPRNGSMKAVIMAGGEGTRLRPLTSNQPKPMVPMVNRPLMEHIVTRLKRHGMTDIVVTVQFLASLVRTYFGDGEDLGVSLAYATEESPLGTAGSVKNAEGALDDTFLVVSGDALTDIDLEKVVAFHREHGALATVVLSRQPDPLEYGIVIADDEGRVERFLEKPGWGQVFSDTVNTGIYVLEPEIFTSIPADTPFDFSKDLFPMLLERGAPLYGYVADGYWCDIGTIDAYQRAHKDVLERKVDVEIAGFEIADGVWVGDGAIIDPDAKVEGPVAIGEHVKIEGGAHIREFTVIGNNAVVKSNSFLHRAIVHDNAYVGESVNLRGCVLGRNADVRRGARLEEGVVLGDEGFVGENAVLQPNVKVYPFKSVEAGAVIGRSIIWESRGIRTLFGHRGVSGLINVDITPDLAVRLAGAYAATLKRGSTVVTCRDQSRAARTIKRAFIAGLNGSGIHVHDLEVAPVPVARFHLRTARAIGGVAIETVPGDAASIEIRFFDATGADIDEGAERAIERVYFREDARRAFPDEIGELRFPPRALEFYQAGLLATLDLEAIRHANLKAVVDCAFGPSALVLAGILGRLGSDILTVNAYVDENRTTMSEEERRYRLDDLSNLVRASRARLGALFDPLGERIQFVLDGGVTVPTDRALLLLMDLVCERRGPGVVVLPMSAPAVAEDIAARHGCSVRRAKHAASALMAAAAETSAIFAGGLDGAYVFPDFTPAFDALASFCRFLEIAATTQDSVADRLAAIPLTHIRHGTVVTPWDQKGAVMRHVATSARADRTDDTEGLKIFHGREWALVLPDPEDPLTHVWSEGASPQRAEALLEEYVAMVRRGLA